MGRVRWRWKALCFHGVTPASELSKWYTPAALRCAAWKDIAASYTRAVLESTWNEKSRARWLFLEEKSTWQHGLGVQQLENRYTGRANLVRTLSQDCARRGGLHRPLPTGEDAPAEWLWARKGTGSVNKMHSCDCPTSGWASRKANIQAWYSEQFQEATILLAAPIQLPVQPLHRLEKIA